MEAKVTSAVNGSIKVIVTRGQRVEEVYKLHNDLRVGDVIEVERRVNNPYLVRVDLACSTRSGSRAKRRQP